MERTEVFEMLRTQLDAAEIPWREIGEGIVLEFTDGCDMLLIDDREIKRTAQPTPSAAAKTLVAKFQKLDERRSAVLRGLQGYSRENQYTVTPSQTGQWVLKSAGSQTYMEVGLALTKSVEKHSPPIALLHLLRWSCFAKPSRANLKRWVAPDEVYEAKTTMGHELATPAASAQSQFCAQFEEALEQAAAEERRRHPEYELLDRLRERLGEDRVTAGCCMPKQVFEIEFTDREGSFAFHSSWNQVRKMLAKHGDMDRVVDHLVDKFTRLDQARGQVLHALDSILATRGCAKDRYGFHRNGWMYGTTHQQYAFDPGTPLTRKLARHKPVEVILAWCEAQKVAPTVTREEIEAAFERPTVVIPTRMLPPVPFNDGPQIPPLDSWDFAFLDALARTWIETFRNEAAKPEEKQKLFPLPVLSYWDDRDWYTRDRDTWVDDRWWIDQARVAWDQGEKKDKPYIVAQQAAFVLLAYGIDLPRERVLEYYRDSEYHPEAIDDGLSWVLEGELPWSMLDDDEDASYPPQLGKLPPRLARNIAMTTREAIRSIESGSDDYDLDTLLKICAKLDRPSAEEWLTQREIKWLHTACMKWASGTDDLTQFWENTPLQIAIHFAWPEVADRLTENPSVATSLLGNRELCIDPSGMVLSLSRLKPDHFAARWAAYLLARDPQAEVEKSVSQITQWVFRDADESLLKGKDRFIKETTKSQTQTQNIQKVAAAIAWHRCREAATLG